MAALEFVIFDRDGNEVDSVDPYGGHEEVYPGHFRVTGYLDEEYGVYIPVGGRYEIRLMEDR